MQIEATHATLNIVLLFTRAYNEPVSADGGAVWLSVAIGVLMIRVDPSDL